jgi:stage V sporulation protein B
MMESRKKFFKSGIMLTSVALSMRSVGMFFSAFITQRVGAVGTGLYTVIMTVYSFAVTVATSGISLTVTRLVSGAIGEGKGGKAL